jgi:hypothetical protein
MGSTALPISFAVSSATIFPLHSEKMVYRFFFFFVFFTFFVFFILSLLGWTA